MEDSDPDDLVRTMKALMQLYSDILLEFQVLKITLIIPWNKMMSIIQVD